MSLFLPRSLLFGNKGSMICHSRSLTLDMEMMQKIMSVVWLGGWISKEQERYMFAPDHTLLSNKEKLLEENFKSNEQDLVLNQVPD